MCEGSCPRGRETVRYLHLRTRRTSTVVRKKFQDSLPYTKRQHKMENDKGQLVCTSLSNMRSQTR